MNQRFVNTLKALSYHYIILIVTVLCSSCVVSQAPATTRLSLTRFNVDVPLDQVAVWDPRPPAPPALAWVGGPSMPNLRVQADEAAPSILALGITPRSLTAFSLPQGRSQLLWLDQNLPNESQLVGGTIDAQNNVVRGPTPISLKPVIEYVAVDLPTGEVLTVWNEYTGPQAPTPLYLQSVDGSGRPLSASQIAGSARYPAIVRGADGFVQIVWLERASPYLWTVHWLRLPAKANPLTGLAELQRPTNSVIGVVALDAGASVTGLSVGLDATALYVVWQVTRLTPSGTALILPAPDQHPVNHTQWGGLRYQVAAGQTQPLNLDLPADLPANSRLGIPSFPLMEQTPLRVACAVQVADAEQARPRSYQPYLFTLTAQGLSAPLALGEVSAYVSRVTLLPQPDQLVAAYGTFSTTGQAHAVRADLKP